MSRTLLSELAHLINPDAQRGGGGRPRARMDWSRDRTGRHAREIPVVDETWLRWSCSISSGALDRRVSPTVRRERRGQVSDVAALRRRVATPPGHLRRSARRQMRGAAIGGRRAINRVTLGAVLAVACSALVLIISPSAAQAGGRVKELAPVVYTAFDGHPETLTPWQGRNVSVMVERGVTREPRVMRRLVRALDRAWGYYARTTGRLPAPVHSLNGRAEIAEVTSTCGAGCTFLGEAGTEILTPYFESMYQQIAQSNLYDQIPFYELGRSFWFWSPQLQFQPPDQDPVVTGFAVWMRFRSMAAAHVKGAPFNGIPFTTFASQVAALAGQYEADPSMTFADTLAIDKSPGLYGGTDFWASLMMQLAKRHGGQTFVARFWHHAADLPAASSTTDAVTNWVEDASYAACTDLSPVFYVRWGFPRPDGSVTPRPPAGTVPEPKGRC
jgi:hypothetical protein